MFRISEEKLKKIRMVEITINKNLFLICIVISVITMSILGIEFFSQRIFPSSKISFFYIGILLIYSIHKEMLRWVGAKRIERQGEWFVYSWIGFTVILYVINFSSKGYFNYPLGNTSSESLNQIAVTTLEICGIFIVTRLSKMLKIILEKR